MNYTLTSDHLETTIEAQVEGNTVSLSNGDTLRFEVHSPQHPNGQGVFFLVRTNAETKSEERVPVVVVQDGSSAIRLSVNGYTYSIDALSERDRFFQQLLKATATKNSGAAKVVAPMPGLLKSINVQQGQRVKKGDRLFILEAMKMENDIKAPMEGIVGQINGSAGTAVEKNFLLCMIDKVEQ